MADMSQDEYEKLCARAKDLIEQIRAFPALEMMAHEDKNTFLRDKGIGTTMWLVKREIWLSGAEQ